MRANEASVRFRAPNWFTPSAPAREKLRPEERLGLLAGRPPAGTAVEGAVVCACFGVGRERLLGAIERDGLVTAQAIGAKLQAGTNCGSCIPELNALIAAVTG